MLFWTPIAVDERERPRMDQSRALIRWIDLQRGSRVVLHRLVAIRLLERLGAE